MVHYLVGGGYSYGVAHGIPGNLGAAVLAGTYYLTTCFHIYKYDFFKLLDIFE